MSKMNSNKDAYTFQHREKKIFINLFIKITLQQILLKKKLHSYLPPPPFFCGRILFPGNRSLNKLYSA